MGNVTTMKLKRPPTTDRELVEAVHVLATKIFDGREDDCVRLTPEHAKRLAELARRGIN